MLLNSLISEPFADFWLGQLSASAALRRPLARIVRMTPASANAVTLELKANRNFAGFAPGQHIPVTAEVNGARITRSYSPNRPMDKPGRVFITVKRELGGILSQHLCDVARPGDVLELGTAFGEFSEVNYSEPLLLLAAGSGITPISCLLQHASAHHPEARIQLIYWAREEKDFCFQSTLGAIADRLSNVHCEFLTTRESSEINHQPTRLSSDLLRQRVPNLSQHRVLACGPSHFVEAARAAAQEHAKQFVCESFSRPAALSNVQGAETQAGSVQITLKRSGKTVQVDRQSSLLEALEAQGLSPAHGCRMGICNTCACQKLSGASRNHLTGETDTEAYSALRLCVSSADTDLTLDL